MHVRVVLVAPMVVLLAGCAALSATVSKAGPTGGVLAIPWIDTKPTTVAGALATPVVGSIPRPCQAKDLRAIYGGATGPVAGKMTAIVNLVNINQDHSDCVIQGIPSIQLFARQGQVALTQVSIASSDANRVLLNPAAEPPKPFIGKAGGAWLEVDWWIAEPGAARCLAGGQPVTVMQLRLSDSSEAIPVDYFADKEGQAVAVCPPSLDVGAFQSSPASAGPPALSPRYWKYTLDVPATVVAGDTLNFQVTLENVYYRALEFKKGCPDYIEDLEGPGGWTSGKIFYILNCGPMGVVEPGGSLVFEMRVDVPASASPGSYTLGWDLDTGNTNYGAATAAFTVSG